MEYKDFIIGGLSGAISRTLTAPLELSKIQHQNRFMPNTTIRDVITNEGLKGLWKGNYSNCLRIFPQMAINYSTYEYSNKFFGKYIKKKHFVNFLSGGIAGMVAMTATYPLENARSRLSLQTNKDHYKGVIDVLYKTPKLDLFNGLRMSIIGYTPYNALNFSFYFLFKKKFNINNDSSQILKLFVGGLAGMSSVSFTYPTDLIRRRLQLQGFDSKVPKYNGINDCIKQIWKYEGIKGLYRGLIPCYLKIFPATAIQFWVIDYLRKIKLN